MAEHTTSATDMFTQQGLEAFYGELQLRLKCDESVLQHSFFEYTGEAARLYTEGARGIHLHASTTISGLTEYITFQANWFDA